MMKRPRSISAAAPMLYLTVAARLFWGMAVDCPSVHNAAWLCPILGAVFALPFLMACNCAARLGDGAPLNNLAARSPALYIQLCRALFAALLVLDCAVNMRMLAGTANVLALGSLPISLLLLPLAAVAAASILLGANAAGNNALLWLRILPVPLLVVLAAQLESCRPGWLTPILGDGVRRIIGGGVYCSGGVALLTFPYLLAEPSRDQKRRSPILCVALGALTASLLLAILQMLCPPLTSIFLSRSSRTELILNNGRVQLSMQLFLIVLWYGGLTHLVSVEAGVAASAVADLLPKAPRWSLAAGLTALAFFLAGSPVATPKQCVDIFMWYYPLTALALIFPLLGALGRERRKAPCTD